MSKLLKENIEALQAQQFSDDILKRMLKDIQKLGKDEEAIKAYLNNKLPKIIGLGNSPRNKAYLTDRLLQQIMGTAAIDEIPGLLESGINVDAIKKIQQAAFGDTSKLEKSLGLNPLVKFENIEEAGSYSPSSGITLNKAYEVDPSLSTQALGTGFHEPSHRSDILSTGIQALKKKPDMETIRKTQAKYTPEILKKINAKIAARVIDQEVLDYYRDANLLGYAALKRDADIQQLGERSKPKETIEELIEGYKKERPGKLSDTEEILNWRPLGHMNERQFLKKAEESGIKNIDEAPFLKLQEILSGKEASHWFKKNFPLEGVLGVAKEGLKGIKSVAPYLKTAGKVGLPLAAAASNYAEAREEGLPAPLAAAYAGVEEVNPLPFSGIDYYKGMEKAAEGRRKNIESMYMPEEMKAEQEFLENYMNSPAAKDKAYGTLREILRADIDDEELIKKLLPKRVVTPFKPED